ncbi:MAG: hypothetical protein JW741_06580 [Sedimentisphaerales bacterium]|nr:hypothetical protein [Sedimentisphaerales bacterium]
MSMSFTEIVEENVAKIIADWVSDGDGDASGQTTYEWFLGKVIGLTTIPSGTAAPADNYDVTITDENGHDVLLGAGADRDTANTEHVAEASLGAVAKSPLTFTVADAGDTKAGQIVLWIRR